MSAFVHSYVGNHTSRYLSGREPVIKQDTTSRSFGSLLEETPRGSAGAGGHESSAAPETSGSIGASGSSANGREPWLMSAEDIALLAGDSAVPPANAGTGAEPAATEPIATTTDSQSFAGTDPLGPVDRQPQVADLETPVFDAEPTAVQDVIKAMRESVMRFASTSALRAFDEGV